VFVVVNEIVRRLISSEIQGSFDYGGKSAAFAQDDDEKQAKAAET
jgi:hypothetical protein